MSHQQYNTSYAAQVWQELILEPEVHVFYHAESNTVVMCNTYDDEQSHIIIDLTRTAYQIHSSGNLCLCRWLHGKARYVTILIDDETMRLVSAMLSDAQHDVIDVVTSSNSLDKTFVLPPNFSLVPSINLVQHRIVFQEALNAANV